MGPWPVVVTGYPVACSATDVPTKEGYPNPRPREKRMTASVSSRLFDLPVSMCEPPNGDLLSFPVAA